MKTCSRCKQVLPLSEFFNCSASKDGLAYRCKACQTAARDRWRRSQAPTSISVIASSRGSRSLCSCGAPSVTYCGFPHLGSTCGAPVCESHRGEIREGLDYCPVHYDRAMAAKAAAKQRVSASGKGVDTALDTRAVAGRAARPENRSAASRRGA